MKNWIPFLSWLLLSALWTPVACAQSKITLIVSYADITITPENLEDLIKLYAAGFPGQEVRVASVTADPGESLVLATDERMAQLRSKMLAQIRATLQPGDEITNLVLHTHGNSFYDDVKKQWHTSLNGVGQIYEDHVDAEAAEFLGLLRPRVSARATVTLLSCKTVCGPADSAKRRIQELSAALGNKDGIIVGATTAVSLAGKPAAAWKRVLGWTVLAAGVATIVGSYAHFLSTGNATANLVSMLAILPTAATGFTLVPLEMDHGVAASQRHVSYILEKGKVVAAELLQRVRDHLKILGINPTCPLLPLRSGRN